MDKSDSSEDDEASQILTEAVDLVASGRQDILMCSYKIHTDTSSTDEDVVPTPKQVKYVQVEEEDGPKIIEITDLEETLLKTKPRLSKRAGSSRRSHRTPADEWAEKKLEQRKKTEIKEKIKSGWEIRKALNETDTNVANDLFLKIVEDRNTLLVEALLKTAQTNPTLELDVNSCDERQKSALRIAIENEDEKMCDLLLNNKVEVRDCLYHAIEKNFKRGVEMILKHDKSINARIIGESFFFPPEISPYQYAAWKNKYNMLKILYENGHRLKEAGGWYEGIMFAWESSNDRKWYFEARASPAHITLMNEMEGKDPLQECLEVIKELRIQAHFEPMFDVRFKELQKQVEMFMCHLMDEVRSSKELSYIFEYDFVHVSDPKNNMETILQKRKIIHYARSTVASILDQACENYLHDFVTHPYAQLAIDYLKYRHTPILHSKFPRRDRLLKVFFGLFFPILSLFYIVNSQSRLGLFISYPPISFHCHVVSDLFFIAFLWENIIYNSAHDAYLGDGPTFWEVIILVWICAKVVGEVQELNRRGAKGYFSDWWNYNDMIYILLFSAAIGFRILDFLEHHGEEEHIARVSWHPHEYRLISEIFLAYAYVFMILRLLGILRTDRILGPLQVSLGKMAINVGQFLSIFALIIMAFTLSLTELFSYYGKDENREFFCHESVTNSTDCEPPPFNTVKNSLENLFWSLFGLMDRLEEPDQGRHMLTWKSGESLLVFYHVTAVIVLINMLIAMMSQTYEETSSRRESVWKFNRTYYWIRFIRRESVLPPPMNLIPSFIFLLKRAKRCIRWCRTKQVCCPGKRRTATEDKDSDQETQELGALKRQKALRSLVQRYKYKVLLNDKNNEIS